MSSPPLSPKSDSREATPQLNRWKRFWRLSGPERGLLLRALALLPAISIGLRLAGFRRMQKGLTRWLPEGTSGVLPTDPTQQAHRIARLVGVAGREGIFRANCLEQSLTLWWLLRRRGFEAELRIGARKRGETFEAHAWVELEGAVLNDEEGVTSEFVRFERDLVSFEVHSR
jgi:hypothetical protein